MLTGDKLETATNIAMSSRLVSRMTPIYTFKPVKTRTEAHNELNNFRKHKYVNITCYSCFGITFRS